MRRNKEKLLAFLRDFHNDKEDEQFSVSLALWGHTLATVIIDLRVVFAGREAIPDRSDSGTISSLLATRGRDDVLVRGGFIQSSRGLHQREGKGASRDFCILYT